MIARVSGVDRGSIRPETALAGELGIDAPGTLEMLIRIEDRFGVEIDETLLRTVGDLLEAVDRQAGD